LGNENTAVGNGALEFLDTGIDNTAVGYHAINIADDGSFNTATGAKALENNAGDKNTATGYSALFANNTGDDNTAIGDNALGANLTGNDNTAVGSGALQSNDAGGNTAVGRSALFSNTSGEDNIALGAHAGENLTTGNFNIHIGNPGIAAETETIRIGDVQSTAYMAGIYGATNNSGIAVFIDSDGLLGTISSAARFKKEIKPMDQASEAILQLRPVTFHYKNDTKGTPQFGSVAEDVAKVNPDLIVRDKEGEIYTVRYEAVNAMLLNEFLKEHKKVEQLEATISQLKSKVAEEEITGSEQKKEIKALAAGLKEQALQIQRVGAQLELRKPAPQTVDNFQ
jgi:hypothetical protein